MLICCEEWAEALTKVCKEHLKEHWRKQPVVIGGGKLHTRRTGYSCDFEYVLLGTPLRIIVNKKWLVADAENRGE